MDKDQTLSSTSDFMDLLEGAETTTETVEQETEQTESEVETETVAETVTETEGATETETETETETTTETTETEEDELTTLRKQNELLLQQLGSAYQPPKTTENNETAETSSQDIDEGSLFGEWKFDDIIENEDSFKKFLGDFSKKIITHTETRLLQKLPGTVSKLTTEQIEARQTVNNFYDQHKQLAQVKPFVANVVSVVASEHADWDLPQVLDEAATRAYKALGLKAQAQATTKPGTKKPAFAGPASGKRGAAPDAGKSKLEKELEELMEF